ncbi:uncharacterized protein LOC141671800 [Apium graveolens]|uniref:uncharacterized protein LOC141671800 n=1 Tax=Apium graveolens TaxID=4045 RepID=UPI003D7B627C
MARMSKFPAKSAVVNSFYLLTGAGVATVFTVHSLNPNFLTTDVKAVLNGVVRSSRAVCTIASSVVDYKYSLYGLSVNSDEYSNVLSEVHLRSAKRVLNLCEANKGFYVKAAQFAAALRKIPKEYSVTLSPLQDKAVPCHFKEIKDVLISNLGPNLSDIFVSLDEQPIAAASIAQVHRAVLKDQQEVAVKVQYPGLEQQMKFDLATMSFLSKSVSLLFPEYRFEWMISEFTKNIAMELDFNQEAKNSERTARNFRDNNIVKVPFIFWEFTTNQVLTMQFCSGGKVDDLDFLKKMEINPITVAKALVEVFAEMIFVHGFLHGDPHPGNILVSPEGQHGFSLVLLDHGVYKELDEDFRVRYCQLWKALILLDSNKILQLGEQYGVGKYARYFPLIFTGRTIDSKSALGEAMSVDEKKNLRQELKSLKVEDYSSFMESVPSEFLTLLRTDELLKSLVTKLGSSQQIRLLYYAKYALRGLSPKYNPENDSIVKVTLSRIRTSIPYIQLRLVLEILELISLVKAVKLSVSKNFREMVISVNYLLVNFLRQISVFGT